MHLGRGSGKEKCIFKGDEAENKGNIRKNERPGDHHLSLCRMQEPDLL